MKITGTAEYIERVKVLPPDDGVHRASDSDGFLKGCHSVFIDGKLVPKGVVGFYFRHKEDKGVKVFYSFKWNKCQRGKYVRNIFRKMQRLHEVCVKPYKIVGVELDFMWRGKRIHKKAFGIKVQHVHWEEKAWTAYARGYPYDFNCLDSKEHPLHNPEGYRKFVKRVKKVLSKTGIKIDPKSPSLKLGDVSYCSKTKRWYLVDVG